MRKRFFSKYSLFGIKLHISIKLAIALALVLIGYMFWGDKNPGSPGGMGGMGGSRPSTPVRVAMVVSSDFPIFFNSLGTITPANAVTIRSRVTGELLRLHFTDGQKVKAGDLLAEIDPAPLKAQVDQAGGQLQRDQAVLQNARQNLARSQKLLPQKSITPQQYDNDAALVQQYEGIVKMGQASLDSAQLQLNYSRIIAPVDGKIGIRHVDEGNIISASDQNGIVLLNQVQPINMTFTVTEIQLPAVLQAARDERRITVEAWDRTQSSLLATGELLAVDNQINTSTGTVRLKAQFENEDDKLFPNQFVNARIFVDTLKNACIVPTVAVQVGNQGSFLYVVDDENRVSMRTVETGPANDHQTVIRNGVAPGEKVVIDGLDRLRDGNQVTIVN